MPKIGDVFSGGGKIGEVWTDDSADGCGAFLMGIFMVIALFIWAIPWTFTHAPGIILGLVLFPTGLLLIRIGIFSAIHAANDDDVFFSIAIERITGIILALLGISMTLVLVKMTWSSFLVTLEIYPESLLAFIVFGLLLVGFYLPLCWWALKWWE